MGQCELCQEAGGAEMSDDESNWPGRQTGRGRNSRKDLPEPVGPTTNKIEMVVNPMTLGEFEDRVAGRGPLVQGIDRDLRGRQGRERLPVFLAGEGGDPGAGYIRDPPAKPGVSSKSGFQHTVGLPSCC